MFQLNAVAIRVLNVECLSVAECSLATDRSIGDPNAKTSQFARERLQVGRFNKDRDVVQSTFASRPLTVVGLQIDEHVADPERRKANGTVVTSFSPNQTHPEDPSVETNRPAHVACLQVDVVEAQRFDKRPGVWHLPLLVRDRVVQGARGAATAAFSIYTIGSRAIDTSGKKCPERERITMLDSDADISVGSCGTPLGTAWVAASHAGIVVMTVPGATYDDFVREVERRCGKDVSLREGGPLVEQAVDEIHQYFMGDLRRFRSPVDLRGTPFQLRVWSAVAAVPYGETVTYREIARRIGATNAYRAVGAANGANPAAIIIPCHRIVGSNGKLQGYGGGLHQKQWLLEMEGRHSAR